LVKTRDEVLHKMDILHNDSHLLLENKDKSLLFVMQNGGRDYHI